MILLMKNKYINERTQYKAVLAMYIINSPRPGQNGRHYVDDIFRCILVNEMFCNWISLKFIPTYPIDNNPALV